jgi:hypothetical protein
MSMKELQEAFDIIEQLNSKDFFSGPKEIELICSAEEALNLIFPPSYKVFLEKYGAGGVNGSEIYGLTKSSKKPFLTPGVPDAIWLTLDERKDDYLPKHFIIISDTGDGYWYCLDASQKNADGEYPVVIWGLHMPEKDKEKVAEDFGEFLLEQTKNALED